MYLVKTPRVIQDIFPNFLWRVDNDDSSTIYLTFDDGPIPELTPWILDQLDAYDAKATFFCVGDNIQKHPDIYEQIVENHHVTGNHSYNHLSGWSTDNIPYFHNIRHCARLVNSDLFRPPYGRIKPSQSQFIMRHYNIVMWDVLSGDFDPDNSREQVYLNVINNARPGSIVVFHDSLKAMKNLKYALPRVLKHFTEQGYRFDSLHKFSKSDDRETLMEYA